MAVLFVDGFDSYQATNDLETKWASADSSWAWIHDQGRKNRGGLVGGTADGELITSPGGWNAPIIAMGFYLRVMSRPAITQELLFLQPATPVIPADALRMDVVNITGSVRLLYTAADLVLEGGVDICDNQFHWIEFRTGLGTGVTHELYIDNLPQAVVTADMPTAYGNIDHIQFSTMGNVITIIDDVVVFDDVAPNPVMLSFPLGPREITTLRPIGDAAVQFARSVGTTNFSLVDDVVSDDDGTFVEDGTSGHQDLYHFEDLSIAPGAITCVVVNSRVKNGGPVGSVAFSSICKSGAAQTNAPSVVTPTNYQTIQQSFALDPQTSAPWSVTGLNASQFGIKVT